MKLIVRVLLACGVMITGLAVMTIAWKFIFPGRIYFCTDDTGFGFFTPGEWVHSRTETVTRIDTLRSMSEPDVIRAGWSERGLWAAWWSMLGCVVLVALLSPLLLRQATGNKEIQ